MPSSVVLFSPQGMGLAAISLQIWIPQPRNYVKSCITLRNQLVIAKNNFPVILQLLTVIKKFEPVYTSSFYKQNW